MGFKEITRKKQAPFQFHPAKAGQDPAILEVRYSNHLFFNRMMFDVPENDWQECIMFCIFRFAKQGDIMLTVAAGISLAVYSFDQQ